MRILPSGPIWGGLALRPLDVTLAGADAVPEFTANPTADPDSNMQFVVGHKPRFGGGVVITFCNNMAAVENPAALQKILAPDEIRRLPPCKKFSHTPRSQPTTSRRDTLQQI